MVQIRQWLQDAIESHAESLACQSIAAKHGGSPKDYFVVHDISNFEYGQSNPVDDVFHFTIYRCDGMNDFQESFVIHLREVLRDYVMMGE
jgi:hypothetical protein